MENLISHISVLIIKFSDFVWEWNAPFLVGAGIYFLIFSKLTPFKYIRHAFDLIRGKHTKQEDIGEVTHFQALTTALSGTIGLGNISGVALAIGYGGPGVIFWMWVTAIVGIATKFFTCTLSVMYRDVDDDGTVRSGPMYIIKNALPKSMMPLAYFFAAAKKYANGIIDLGSAFLIMYIGPLRTVPSSSTSRYITDKVQVKNLVAIPTIAVTHIQNITPGPP